MTNGKVMISLLIFRLVKKYKMIQYFPKSSGPFGGNIDVKADISNYATKAKLKNATGIDTSNCALKSNLANWKAEVYKIDVDKFKTIPDGLSELSNVVKNEVVKKNVYDK